MSWQATSWALRNAPVGGNTTARLILVSLADRAGVDGRNTWPSVRTLVDELHISDSTVRRQLAWLEERGIISRGDQSMAARNAHGKAIPPQFRPVVWNLNMGVPAEQVEEAEEGPLEVRPVKMTGQSEPRNEADSRPVKMTGQENGDDSRPVTHADSDLSPVTDKPVILKPSPSPSNEGVPRKDPKTDVDRDATRVTDALRTSLELQIGPRPSDKEAAARLVREHGVDLVLAVVKWCTAPASDGFRSRQDGFWRTVLTGARSLERNWPAILLQMQGDPTGISALKRLRSKSVDAPHMVRSLADGKQYPVYWGHLDQIGCIRDHFAAFDSTAGRPMDPGSCPVCGQDTRNQATHGIEGRQDR